MKRQISYMVLGVGFCLGLAACQEEELAPATAGEGAAEPEVIGEKEKAEKAAAAEAEGKKK